MGAVSIRGDFGELAGFKKKLGRLKTAVKDTSKGAVPALQAAVDATSSAGQDAFGTPHAPRKDGGEAFASVSGKLAKVRARGADVVASVTRRVPRYEHRGRAAGVKPGGFMPARPIIPEEGDELPKTWEDALTKSAEKVFDDKAVR